MLRRLLSTRPSLTRTPTPPPPPALLLVRPFAAARPAAPQPAEPPPVPSAALNLPPVPQHPQQRHQQQQQMISPPPPAPAHPTVSRSQLVSPTSADQPPPDLTDAQLRRPTVELYEDPKRFTPEELARPETHGGPYAVARSTLDYTYHKKPTLERRLLQDEIVTQVLAESHAEECRFCHSSSSSPATADRPTTPINDSNDITLDNGRSAVRRPKKPVALFTSGGMGAGKGHVLRTFLENGSIRLDDDFVWIDPDKISRILPERPLYLAANPVDTATLLHAESSLVQELLTHAAREQRRSVVIDGSLSCSTWFRGVMRDFRTTGYLVEVLFVFCTDEDVMWRRAERRRIKTGRRVSRAQIRASRVQSPESVQALSTPDGAHERAAIDRLRLVDNSSDDPADTPRIVYDSRDDRRWSEEEGGDVDVVRIALGDEGARASASARARI